MHVSIRFPVLTMRSSCGFPVQRALSQVLARMQSAQESDAASDSTWSDSG